MPGGVLVAANTATGGAPVWETRFGYPSNTTLGSGNKVFEPRLAFNYTFDGDREAVRRQTVDAALRGLGGLLD